MSHLIIIIYLLLVLVCLHQIQNYSWLPGPWWCSILVSWGRYCLFVCHDCYKYLTHLLADTRQACLIQTFQHHQVQIVGEKPIRPVLLPSG